MDYYIVRVKIKHYEQVLSFLIKNQIESIGNVFIQMNNKYAFFSVEAGVKTISAIEENLKDCRPRIIKVAESKDFKSMSK